MSDTLIQMQREIEGLKRQLRQFTSGQYAGIWTAYTPSWTSDGTNPVLGNGTLVGRYIQIGKLVTVAISLITGSTTTYGTGNYNITLPVAKSASDYHTGSWWAIDSSAGLRYGGTAAVLGTSPAPTARMVVNGAVYMTSTSPFTLAAADSLRVQVSYEAA